MEMMNIDIDNFLFLFIIRQMELLVIDVTMHHVVEKEQ